MLNIFSFLFRLVFIREIKTPSILKINTANMSKIPVNPVLRAYFILTAAPTSTKSIISAATQSLEYFKESLFDNSGLLVF